MCSDRNNIYVFGGKPDDMSAHKFDVCHGIWSSLPEMNRRRRCTGNFSSWFLCFSLYFFFLSSSCPALRSGDSFLSCWCCFCFSGLKLGAH